jgi:hypothetical protein
VEGPKPEAYWQDILLGVGGYHPYDEGFDIYKDFGSVVYN